LKIKKITIQNKTGLHARPATEIVKIAMTFKSDIKMKVGEKIINCKSPLEIMAAGIKENTNVELQVNGEDEKIAIEKLIEVIEKNLGE
jgi:phosphotransferase system HPr (HPr) family protein